MFFLDHINIKKNYVGNYLTKNLIKQELKVLKYDQLSYKRRSEEPKK